MARCRSLTFRQGTDPNIAQVQVQNKLALGQPLLPPEVVAQGLSVTKATKNFMMIICFISADRSMDEQAIGDYVASNVEAPVSRISGVGDCTLFGAEYSMRVWLDPARLDSLGLTVTDARQAITNQNIQVSSGEIGGVPETKGQRLDATIIGPTRLNTPEQFEKILLKVNPDGSQVRLKDVVKAAAPSPGRRSKSADRNARTQPSSRSPAKACSTSPISMCICRPARASA